MFRHLPFIIKNILRNRRRSVLTILSMAAHFASKIRYLEKGELLPEGTVPQDWAPVVR